MEWLSVAEDLEPINCKYQENKESSWTLYWYRITICDKFYIELPINLLYVDKKVEDSSSKKTNQVANDGTCSTKIKETLIRYLHISWTGTYYDLNY